MASHGPIIQRLYNDSEMLEWIISKMRSTDLKMDNTSVWYVPMNLCSGCRAVNPKAALEQAFKKDQEGILANRT